MTSQDQLFQYRGVRPNGQIVDGQISATDVAGASALLLSQGITALQCRPIGAQRRPWLGAKSAFSLEQKSRFLGDLALLLDAGMSLLSALKAIKDSNDSRVLSSLAQTLSESLSQGQSLSAAMEASNEFDAVTVAVVESGEASAKLPDVLQTVALDYLERVELRGTIVSACAYPAFLLVLFILSLAVITFFLVPALEPIFADTGAPPPLVFSALLSVRAFVLTNTLGFIAAFAILSLALAFTPSRAAITTGLSSLLIRLPWLNTIRRRLLQSRYLHVLGLLLANGVPLARAMRLAAQLWPEAGASARLKSAMDDVSNGTPISAALSKTTLFPPSTLSLLAMGDEANKLGEISQRASTMLRAKARKDINRLVGLLTPAMTILTGLMIGSLIISVMNTLLSVNELAI